MIKRPYRESEAVRVRFEKEYYEIGTCAKDQPQTCVLLLFGYSQQAGLRVLCVEILAFSMITQLELRLPAQCDAIQVSESFVAFL